MVCRGFGLGMLNGMSGLQVFLACLDVVVVVLLLSGQKNLHYLPALCAARFLRRFGAVRPGSSVSRVGRAVRLGLGSSGLGFRYSCKHTIQPDEKLGDRLNRLREVRGSGCHADHAASRLQLSDFYLI